MKWFALLAVAIAPVAFAQSLEDARGALERGQHQRALEDLDAFLSRNPGNPDGRFMKGLAQVMLEQDAEAIRTFSDLARDYPELPEPYNNLAVLYARNGQYEKARDALETALVTHPSYATAHENLGDIYAALANSAYNRALVLDKGNDTLRTKLDLVAQLTDMKDGGAPISVSSAARPSAPTPRSTPAPRPAATPAPVTATPRATAAPRQTPPPVPEPVISGNSPITSSAPAPAPAPAPATSSADAGAQNAVLAAVERWRAAWSAQDVDNYLNAYSDDFLPATGISHDAWKSQRRRRVTRPSSIQVQVINPQVRMQSGSEATITFRQIYESNTYADQVRKELSLQRRRGGWKITGERVIQ